ncbi:MAG: sugar phosphate isomerase/epimerase [Chloroflexi bacterium]|nr:sugar phosphate isomerase/epimerase [Chloroflexota bacterium]
MPNIIACRPESYGRYGDRAFEDMCALGIRYVEIPAPPLEQVETVSNRLREHGLSATSVTCGAKVQDPDFLEKVSAVVAAAAALHAPVIFTSQKAGEMDKSQVFDLLRRAGDAAGESDTTFVLETHPDLCENGQNALATMQAIDHPHVRINFDPANVHYYNQHVNAVTEFKKVLPYVRAVHLKDTNGGYQAHHFPAIGDGVVDWQTIFALMNERGIEGPFTLEMEGIAGEQLTFEETSACIRRSLEYPGAEEGLA